jgi:hypothetical protein
MARSARRRSGGKRVAQGTRKRAGGTGKATEVMTAIRLFVTICELIQAVARDGHWPDGGPGRFL